MTVFGNTLIVKEKYFFKKINSKHQKEHLEEKENMEIKFEQKSV